MAHPQLPHLGIGIGLRPVHYEYIFDHCPNIDWFEIISENFMVDGGRPLENLEKILDRYPVVQHGVSLTIGSHTPLDFAYLKKLKDLTKKTKTPWVSDHLCWGRAPGAHYHDLLPLPYTKEVIDYVAERARIVQDYLELPFALENLSSYVTFNQDEMPEWEFYSAIVDKAGIYMMLDVNNVYVSSRNHHFDPMAYLSYIPLDKVLQIHLAGHTDHGDYVLDTHDTYVKDEVWDLYARIYPKTKGVSTLLEWDDNHISFEDTWKEALKAKQFQQNLTEAHSLCHTFANPSLLKV
ncbi:MAG: MNIO family bufferin maturase [Parachlamydiaceae bacterium]